MLKAAANRKGFKGFTLVELAVVIVIIGVLAAFGVPRFIKSVERSKAAEAFSYLAAIRSAQERYHAREGNYADDIAKIDIKVSVPKYFTIGAITPSGSGIEAGWTQTLTRIGPSAGYGAYTVSFTQDGYDSGNSSIDGFPDINSLGNDPITGSSDMGSGN